MIDAKNETAVDYKTESALDSRQLTDNGARQLKVYAYLAMENGIPIGTGVVERGNRIRAQIRILTKDAEDESRRARETLGELNRFAGRRCVDGASPSPKACRRCPCIPFCPAFWEASIPSWEDEGGIQLEGVVESIESGALMSLYLNVDRGTGTRGLGVVSRLSKRWIGIGRSSFPQPGRTVRLTDARKTNRTGSPTEFRVDRAATAVWKV